MKNINWFSGLCSIFLVLCSCSSPLPSEEKIDDYVSYFNSVDTEYYSQAIPNEKAAEFLKNNIPLFDCPDKELEKTYYFRWWTFRKHIRQTPEGYVITEFLPDVGWAKKYNTINCAVQHHFNEGRWLKDSVIMNDCANFWLFGSGEPDRYSLAMSDALWQYYLVKGNDKRLFDAYPRLCSLFNFWKNNFRDSTGLYWRVDGWDGMEISVGGSFSQDASGYRPTVNSYQYADAKILSKIAAKMNLSEESDSWKAEAASIKNIVDSVLWDPEKEFYKVRPRGMTELVKCRELLGYIPWIYDLPDEDKGNSWKPLFDTMGFWAPFGPTTAERSDPGFALSYEGHDCQWNGPTWPYSTSQTLTAMASCYQRFGEKFFTRSQYFDLLQVYSLSHRKGGVCWIDENINPFTGDWIARTKLIAQKSPIKERGKDYNHSTFCDLVISGLVGVRPQEDGTIVINPMLPSDKWNWFSLTGVNCSGKVIDIVYDKYGWHYDGVDSGFNVFVDGQLMFHSDKIESCNIQ